MYRMSSGYARVLVNTLSAQGLDVDSLCQEAGLDIKRADIPGLFYERSTVYRLWDLAAQASSDPNIGLKAYENFHPGIFQIVGYTMMSSLNLKKAFERLVHFSPLISTGFSLFFVQEQQHYRLAALDHHQRGSIKPRHTPMPASDRCWVLSLAERRQIAATAECGVQLSPTGRHLRASTAVWL